MIDTVRDGPADPAAAVIDIALTPEGKGAEPAAAPVIDTVRDGPADPAATAFDTGKDGGCIAEPDGRIVWSSTGDGVR